MIYGALHNSGKADLLKTHGESVHMTAVMSSTQYKYKLCPKYCLHKKKKHCIRHCFKVGKHEYVSEIVCVFTFALCRWKMKQGGLLNMQR